MLEQRDLVLIAEVVEKAILPVKNDVSELKEDVSALKSEMREVKDNVGTLQSPARPLKITRENETNKEIRRIAGYSDLNRKPDETLRIENEKEIMKLYVSYLESEMKKMKTILSEMEKKKKDELDEIA